MGPYLIIGETSQAARPMEKHAVTAAEAEVLYYQLCRLCGGRTKVAISGQHGASLTVERLSGIARKERAACI